MPTVERCLVTGADGFIGKILCRRLAADGVQVIRLVHRAGGPNDIEADLGRDPIPSLKGLNADVVFHLAARVHEFDHGPESEAQHCRVTVGGTRDLLAAAVEAGVTGFVFFSTCAVMPAGRSQALDEGIEPQPSTPYGRAKLAAEDLVIGMNGISGLRTSCLRLPMVYGPGQKGQLPRMINAIERGFFPPLPEFEGKRSMVHVDDAVEAALLVATDPRAAGQIYIVSEARPYTAREMYEVVVHSLGRRSPTWRVPRFLFTAGAVVGDFAEVLMRRQLPFDSEALRRLSQPAYYSGARIERDLGFTPKKSFDSSAGELTSRRRL